MLMRNCALFARVVRASDSEEIDGLIERSVRTLCARDHTPRQIESVLRHAARFDVRLAQDGSYFAATDGARIVGVGAWSFRSRGAPVPNGPVLDPAHDAARVCGFFVDPAHARRGIGRMLLKLCEAAAAEAGFARLELVSSLTGVPLYRAGGFEALGTIDITFPDGVMVRGIPMAKRIRDRRRYNIPRK